MPWQKLAPTDGLYAGALLYVDEHVALCSTHTGNYHKLFLPGGERRFKKCMRKIVLSVKGQFIPSVCNLICLIPTLLSHGIQCDFCPFKCFKV